MKRKGTNDKRQEKGFTIIEMMVAVALFAIVMVISAGALLSLASANRKAQALQSVMNNLNTTLDSMVRSMREGSTYDASRSCAGGNSGGPKDCTGGGTYIIFQPHEYNPPTVLERAYQFVPSAASCGSGYTGGCIKRSLDGGNNWTVVTAPEISIVDMNFYVVGTTPGDTVQPKVVLEIKGIAGANDSKTKTTFHIQATAVQRVLDI